MASIAPPVTLPIPSGGVRPDLQDTEVPADALMDAENWVRREGKFRVRPGFASFASLPSQRPTALIQYRYHDLSSKLVLGTVASWWRYNAGTNAWVDLAGGVPLTASATQLQVFRTFSKAGATWLLGVNGKDAPKKWDGAAAAYASIGGAPPIATCMMSLADRVLLGNLSSGGTVSPVAVDVSANKDFDNGWGAVVTAVLAETPGQIVAMQEMGFLQGAIYKEDSIYLAVALDGTVPFRFPLHVQNVRGPVSSQAVTIGPDGLHLYLADDAAVYAFDGTAPRSLGLAIQRQIAQTITVDRLGRSWVAWDSRQQMLWVVYPAVGGADPTRGVVITWPGLQCYPVRWASLTPTCGAWVRIPSGLTIGDLNVPIGDLGMTLAEMDTTVPRFVIGNSTGQCYADSGLTDAGDAIPAYFETGLNDLGNRAQFRTVTEAEHFFPTTPGSQPVSVRLGASDYGEERVLEDDPTGTENALDLQDGGPYRTGHNLTAKLVSLRVEGDATQPVEYLGSVVNVQPRGLR